MSQSRSDSHLNYRSPPARPRTSPFRQETPDFRSNYVKIGDDFHRSPIPSPTRGRLCSRTPSPNKLNDINEDQTTDFPNYSPTYSPAYSPPHSPAFSHVYPLGKLPPSPTKRSRSPMKQLFGQHGWLGRSTSMKELPSDEYRKTGFKHWSGKLKQRVEEIVSVHTSNSLF